MNLFDNIIKNAIELQILSIILDTSDIKKFYYRGIAHIWNCSLKFKKLNRYYHFYRQNNLFDGITLVCVWGVFDSHRGGHKFIFCKNDLDFNISLSKITKIRFARGYKLYG